MTHMTHMTHFSYRPPYAHSRAQECRLYREVRHVRHVRHGRTASACCLSGPRNIPAPRTFNVIRHALDGRAVWPTGAALVLFAESAP
jgi:hypothetical protein